jgi:hypothetical protein
MTKRHRRNVRADTSTTRGTSASARRCRSRAIWRRSPGRCSTGSICRSKCRRWRRRRSRHPRRASRRRRSASASRRPRQIQRERFRRSGAQCNGEMSSRQLRRHCELDAPSRHLIEQALARLGLSARAYDRVLRWRARSRTSRDASAWNPGTSRRRCTTGRWIGGTSEVSHSDFMQQTARSGDVGWPLPFSRSI